MNARDAAVPSSDEQQLEARIVAAGLTAPRITPADIDGAIKSTHFFTAAQGVAGAERAGEADPLAVGVPSLGLLTFCVLVLRNGFTVTGESACASPENFNAQVGRDIALRNARDKIWSLEGYLLREHLSRMDEDILRRARAAHEVNRIYCQSIGDNTVAPWEHAPNWQRASVIEGVKRALAGATPRELHESWCDFKRADGWTFGPVKDADAKTHPCLVDYDDLPEAQRVKDQLFRVAVQAA